MAHSIPSSGTTSLFVRLICSTRDENAIIERAGVNDSQDTVGEKSDGLSPVEAVMVEKLVNGVLLNIEKTATKLVYPHSPDALFEERREDREEKHVDGSITLKLSCRTTSNLCAKLELMSNILTLF
jgi:hypothetical protein